MAFDLVQKIIREAGGLNPSFILIGGEPLLYSFYPQTIGLLRERKLFSTTCTNGLALSDYEELFIDNPFATLLVSLDGLQTVNDSIRGDGVFQRVTRNIERIISRKRHSYLGLQFTVSAENVHEMFDFCVMGEQLGVDWILFNLTWFITDKEARSYEEAIRFGFNITPTHHHAYSMPYGLDPAAFIKEYTRIKKRCWRFQVSCYLREPKDILTYMDEDRNPFQDCACSKQYIRMDVLPSGEVVPCSLFPDIKVGNIAGSSIGEIWNGAKFQKFRSIARSGDIPLCKKCDAAYLYDLSRTTL